MKVLKWFFAAFLAWVLVDIFADFLQCRKINKILRSNEWKEESDELNGKTDHKPEFVGATA